MIFNRGERYQQTSTELCTGYAYFLSITLISSMVRDKLASDFKALSIFLAA